MGPSPPPSLPPSLPAAFPLAATRAVTHAVKILPGKTINRKCGRPGIGGCRADAPGKGLGTAPGPWQGGAGGSPSTPAQRGTPRPPSRGTASTPGSGAFGEAKVSGREGRGPGMILGGFFPWSPAWAGKASHGNPPSTGVTPAAGIDPRVCLRPAELITPRVRGRGGTWSPPSSQRGLAAAGFLPGHRLPAG